MKRSPLPGPADDPRQPAVHPSVLVVGQASAGGIGVFIHQLIDDPWLQQHARLKLFDSTIPGWIHPGAPSVANARLALHQAWNVYRLGRSVQVVHLNVAAAPSLPLLRALTLTVVSKLSGARVILHTHGGFIQHAAARRPYRTLLRLAVRAADVFVVNSRTNQAAVTRLGGSAMWIGNGTDPTPFRVGPRDEDPPVITFVGTVCARKGLIDLRDALRSLWPRGPLPVRVLIAGDGKQEGPGAFELVKRSFEDAGLAEAQFLGKIGRPQIIDLLARTTLFCLPSHWESFPLAVLEAMAAGVPVVATEVGDTPYILDNGRAGTLVPPHDVSALAGAIQRLLAHPDERERLAEAGRDRVRTEFGADRVVGSIYRLYLDLAERGARPPRTGRVRPS